MDPPAPGACPLPRLPTSWLGPQPPLPLFNHPSISSASSRCWESLKQGWGRGAIHSCPLLPRQLGTGPWQWGKSTGNFPRGLQGLQEHHPCSQIPAPEASQPRARQEGRSQRPLPLPRPRGRGPEAPGDGEGRGGLPVPALPAPPPPGRPPDTPPRVPSAPRADLGFAAIALAAPPPPRRGPPPPSPPPAAPGPRRRKRAGPGPGGRG